MGLFDFFKRRAKEAESEQSTEEKQAAQSGAATSSESTASESSTAGSENVDTTTAESLSEEVAPNTNEITEPVSAEPESSSAESSAPVATESDSTSSQTADTDTTIGAVSQTPSGPSKVGSAGSETEPSSAAEPNLEYPAAVNSENEDAAESLTESDSMNLKADAESLNPANSDSSAADDETSQAVTPAANAENSAFSGSSEESASESKQVVSDESKDTENDEVASNESEDSTKPTSAPTEAERYDKGLEKSRQTFGQRLNHLLANFRSVDESFFDDLEETLIGADVGFDMAMQISDQLREEVKLQNVKKPKDVQNVIVQKMIELYDAAGTDEQNGLSMAPTGPTVILFVGVNGVGKTTTIGKMANLFKNQGKKILLAAADTFRAGAIQQLNVWAERDGVDIVKKPEQSDPSSVVFDALQKAKAENYDILFVDTAGRLQNKSNLMNELAKMKRVITREIPDAPHEVLLVLDATTGQNALNQAKLFKEATDVTGIVLTKLDGTARGGIVLAIRNELHLPVKYVGLGEQVDDLRPFEPTEFVYGLFKGLIDVD